MRLAKKLFVNFLVLGVALCLFGIGQKAFAEGACEEFEMIQTPWEILCMDMYHIPHIAFGGGWTTTLRGANINDHDAKGNVRFVFILAPAGGYKASDGHAQSIYTIYKDNRRSILSLTGNSTIWMKPGWSLEVDLLHRPGGCDQYGEGCPYDPFFIDPEDRLTVGNVVIGYYMTVADGAPAGLRGLPKPSAQFNHVSGLQATEPAFDPAPRWMVPVSATADLKGKLFMFAMGNPYPEDVVVQGKLMRYDGEVTGVQSWTIPGQGSKALYLTNAKSDPTPGFEMDPFRDDKDFTGWLELRVVSPEGGLITVVGLQQTGNVMSSADVQPFYPKQ